MGRSCLQTLPKEDLCFINLILLSVLEFCSKVLSGKEQMEGVYIPFRRTSVRPSAPLVCTYNSVYVGGVDLLLQKR